MTDLPDFLKNSKAPRLAERTIVNLGSPTPPYLSIMGNKFTEVDATGQQEPAGEHDKQSGTFYYDAVVIDTLEAESKIYYEKPFDPNSNSYAPPDCWSDNGIAPSRNASNPQHATCSGCPKAEWGSAVSKVSGKGVPACGKYQKLALLPTPLMEGEQMLFLLRVPPNSLGNLRDYLAKFRGQQFDLKDVITRIQFAPEGIGTLTFRATGFIDPPIYQVREGLYTKKATDSLVGRGDVPRAGLAAPDERRMIDARPMQGQGAPAQTAGSPSAGAPVSTPAQSQNAPTTGASPSDAPPRRRRGRPAAAQAEPAQAAPAGGPAPFRESPPPTANGPAQNFGIQNATPADPDLAKTIDSVFGR